MFKRIGKQLSNSQILLMVCSLKKTRKVLTIIAVISLIMSAMPWQIIEAYNGNIVNNGEHGEEFILGLDNSNQEHHSFTQMDPRLVPIDFEDISLRTETSKTFRKIDGTYEIVIYDEVVHYLENGSFKEIDNNLVDNGNNMENQSNRFKVKFPKKIENSKQIKLTMDDYQIDWAVININESNIEYDSTDLTTNNVRDLLHIKQSLVYKNIREHLDLEYIITGNQVKENIILHEYIENFSLAFEYKVKDLEIILDDEGNIVFVNDTNEVIFVFSDLFMVDAAENYSEAINFELVKTGNKTYYLNVIPSDEWLSNATYPVYIDPTIVSPSAGITIFDTYISEANPTQNYYNSTSMPLSNSPGNGDFKSLLYFNIPSQLMDKVITYSSLTLTSSVKAQNRQVNIHKNTHNFSSNTVTWASWHQNGVQRYEDRVIDYHIVGTDNQYHFDITKAVKEWQATGNTRTTGFTIVDNAPNEVYHSVRQNHTTHNLLTKPTVVIGYEEPSGLKDYWTYTSQNLGTVGTGYIGDYTGNLTWVRDEYNLNNEFMSLGLKFYYNTHTRHINYGYGNGWKTNYDIEIFYDTFSNSYYMLKPDGNKVHFMNESCEHVADGDFKCLSIAEDGSRMELERWYYYHTGENLIMSLTTTTGLKYYFNGNGRLTRIQNMKTTHSLNVFYNAFDRVHYVSDEAGNRIQFFYNHMAVLTSTELRLKQSGTVWRSVEKNLYTYDSNNNLDYVRRSSRYGNGSDNLWSSEERLEYEFDRNNKLLNAYSLEDQVKVDYLYDHNNRVIQVIKTNNALSIGELNISYTLGKTTYTNHLNDSIYYLFDNYGHTVNIIDDYGNAIFYQYSGLFPNGEDRSNIDGDYSIINAEPNYYSHHKLIEKTSTIKQQHNPITNHGFELGTWGWTKYELFGGAVNSTAEHANFGTQSLSVTSTSSTWYSFADQQVYLDQGTYTITGWIKNSGAGPGAYLDVINTTSKGIINKVANSDGWEKVELSFYISSARNVNIRLINASESTAYFDNIYLFEGYSYTACNDDPTESCGDYTNVRYNVITNSSFEKGTVGWSANGNVTVDINETGIMQDILGTKAIKLIGNGNSMNSVSQNLGNLSTSQSTYIIAGWAKADAVPNKTYYRGTDAYFGDLGESDGRFFGIKVCYFDLDYADTFCEYLSFNPDISDWQFQMRTINVPSSAMHITVTLMYQGAGSAYFDNIQFYHDNVSVQYVYNAINGNLQSVSNHVGTTTYTYDENFNIIAISNNSDLTDINRNETYQIEEIIKNNVRHTLLYNSTTKHLEEKYVGFDQSKDFNEQDKWFKTTTSYTSDGQYISSVTDEFGNTVSATTDYSIGLITEIMDALGNTQGFQYDARGNLITTVATDSDTLNSISSSYEYNSSGSLVKIHRDGYWYEIIYNALNQVESVKIAGTEVMKYDYVKHVIGDTTYYTNLLEKQTYGNQDYIEFTYTKENRIKTVSFNGAVRFEYEYDSSGRLSVYKDIHNSNIYFYSYDLAGRLKAIVDKDENTIEYHYDSMGNLSETIYSISDIIRGVTYNYNEITGMYEYTQYNVGSSTITKEYNYQEDSLRRLNNIDLIINNHTFSKLFSYDDNNVDSSMGNATSRVSKIIYKTNDSTHRIHEFTYDENHNIIQKLVKSPSLTIETYDYYYDGFNQLIKEDISIYNQMAKTITYSYDTQGNITSIKEFAYKNVSGTPVKEKRMFYQNTWKDQLTKIEYYENGTFKHSETYIYDASGNVTGIFDSRTYHYNNWMQWEGRQLTNFTSYCESNTYTYNDMGIRTSKQLNSCGGSLTTTYTLDGDKVLIEERSDGTTLYFTYDVDGTLLSMNYNGNEYFYITNLQGDIIELVDISGNIVATYSYDAWGNIISKFGAISDINPYRYRGYRWDEESGYYYLNSRYYNPQTGRFINSDRLLGELGEIKFHNTYAYTENNPVMFIDPNGESIIGIIIIVSGMVITAVAVASIIVTVFQIREDLRTVNEGSRVNFPNGVDSENEVMLEVFFDQKAKEYVENKYLYFRATSNSLMIAAKIFFLNVPVVGAAASRSVQSDIDAMNITAATSLKSITSNFNTHYLEVAGADYDYYLEYFKERVVYWRRFYER
ncbi:RHS repeat-associated core domain-containing protein [Liberiplasma polymorphum]|uniref:RHS repeat-associated core domain-containing protein n=1 Tax=Liberiplasma polymorphum TaxID=3374570 RepID=UPI003774E840